MYKLLKSKGVFLDIGANIGYYSVYMYSKVKKVYSFEPDPRTCNVLKQNTENKKSINIVPNAVGKTTGIAEFTLESTGETSHLSRKEDSEINKIEIAVTTVYCFVLENQLRVEAIKTDVEGFDFDVLTGAYNTLKSQRPIVLTEASLTSELVEFIKRLDYHIFAYIREIKSRKIEFIKIESNIPNDFIAKMLFLVPAEIESTVIKQANSR